MNIATSDRPKPRVTNLLSEMKFVTLAPDDPALDALVTDYHTKYALGKRRPETERATSWYGMEYNGNLVAVMGDRREGRTLEITDAYFDGSVPGKTAFAALAYAYRKMLEDGAVDALVHTILQANEAHWRAIERETGDQPYARVYYHKRKGS